MRVIRRLTLCSGAAFVLVSLWASVAVADTLRQSGVPVSTPYTLTMTTPNVTLAGTLPQPITCTSSALTRTITVNGIPGNRVQGDVNAWGFSGCSVTNGSTTVPCTVVTTGTPWVGAVALNATTSPQAVSTTLPSGASITTTCTFAGGPITCSYVPSSASTLKGDWINSPTSSSPASTSYQNEPLTKVSGPLACNASAAFTATYATTVPNITLTL
jgi:hypothetical protein